MVLADGEAHLKPTGVGLLVFQHDGQGILIQLLGLLVGGVQRFRYRISSRAARWRRHQHIAAAVGVRRADQALALQFLDQAGGTVVADGELALHRTDVRAAGFGDELDNGRIQRILLNIDRLVLAAYVHSVEDVAHRQR
ncbi:hypothetical protein D9M68_849220 [compost metagenome]